MRIATWNLQRKRPTSSNVKIAIDHLRSDSPDIAVLTEAWVDHLGPNFQHADAGPTRIPHLREEERKVVIASHWPITNVQIDLDVPTAGRIGSGASTGKGETRESRWKTSPSSREPTRDTKYDSSLERVVSTIDSFATFPAIERRKLSKRVLFCFLTGNEDMHLKNFSLITRKAKVKLSPAYDLLDSSIVLQNPSEESALPIRGKRNNLTRHDLVRYFCQETCRIPESEVMKLLDDLSSQSTSWPTVIRRSFLGEEMKERYLELIEERSRRLFAG